MSATGPWKELFTLIDLISKPNSCNDHIYHLHASQALNLIFVQSVGGGGRKSGGQKGRYVLHEDVSTQGMLESDGFLVSTSGKAALTKRLSKVLRTPRNT